MAKDRRSAVILSHTLNGIDFVEIASSDQKTLRVHFLNPVALAGTFQTKDVSITGGEVIPSVPILPVNHATDWATDLDGNPLLTLRVAAPGDFSTYTLSIASPTLDAYSASVPFSFKALCDSLLDCKTPDPVCPPAAGDLPPIDYLAKDFLSFRKALGDFSALRYPDWKERAEADFGVMMMEALCAVADDLSYMQDRVQAESELDTATQRRSLVRLARLVDYEPAPATVARVLLRFEMASPGPVPAGLLLSAAGPDGAPIYFETGAGLDDTSSYPADPRWNQLKPYFFDDAGECLKAGATEMWVEGHGWGFYPGQQLLIETAGATTADPAIRQVVQLDAKKPAAEEDDLIFGQPVTHLFWRTEDALLKDRSLTPTAVGGNLIPATQGRRFTDSFHIDNAVARTGPNTTTVYQYTLVHTAADAGLAWLPPQARDQRSRPEIAVTEDRPNDTPLRWTWQRWLLDAGAFDPAFTIDPVQLTRIAINSDQSVQMDYRDDQADSIRFGDGVFGLSPDPDALFNVIYRVGGGRAGNVAPDSVWRIEAPSNAKGVTNPFAGEGGSDAETPLSIRRNAPEAFRATQFRAVRREDYQNAAERLDWVQRAGTTFRWTGSWITVFTTPDPKGGVGALGLDNQVELVDLLNRYRMAGYESYVPNPRYAALDLKITVCARSDAFRGDVFAGVLDAVSTKGFFHPDNFTFGQALERSALEAAIQRAPGVGGVVSIQYRRRGFTKNFVNMADRVAVGVDEIILVENDPSRPERGSVRLTVVGGK